MQHNKAVRLEDWVWMRPRDADAVISAEGEDSDDEEVVVNAPDAPNQPDRPQGTMPLVSHLSRYLSSVMRTRMILDMPR